MDAGAYNNHVGTIVQHSMVGLSMALGHKLGLIQAMCDAESPVTSEELAKKLGYKERYTREWLSSMAAGDVINIEPDTNRFYVPEEHKFALGMQSSFSPYMFHCSDSLSILEKCFQEKGPYGLSYEERGHFFNWFHNWRSTVTPHYIDTEMVVYFELHGFKQKLESGIKVLDLGCASGTFTRELAKRFPNSTFIGLDISEDALQMARQNAEKYGFKNLEFVKGDANSLPTDWTNTFDVVLMCDVAHDLPDPEKAMGQVHRILKDDGLFNLIEFNVHSNPADNVGNMMAGFLYSCSLYVCIMSSLSAKPHIGFGACWGHEDIEKSLDAKGFTPLGDKARISQGMQTYFYYKKK